MNGRSIAGVPAQYASLDDEAVVDAVADHEQVAVVVLGAATPPFPAAVRAPNARVGGDARSVARSARVAR